MDDPDVPALGDDAPRFTAPVADDDGISPRSLSDYLGDTPTVLAFYPAAFSNTCTTEFCTFRDRLGPLASDEATVLGDDSGQEPDYEAVEAAVDAAAPADD